MKFRYITGIFLTLSSIIVCLNGTFEHGVAHMQGRRHSMEDAHTSVDRLSDGRTSLFAIFDGHGGNQVADYVAQRIQYAVERSATFPHNLTNTLRSAFEYLDQRLAQGSHRNIAQTSGSTAVVALIQQNQLYTAHAGDSRALLSRNGQVVTLTHDHRPDRPDERARIEAAGGAVITFGVPRVNGNLAVSRAFGDLALRSAGVIATPEITHTTLIPQDEFLLLACDGVFERNMTDQQAVTFVRDSLARHQNHPQAAQRAAQELIQEAYNRGSRDNISALVILFNRNQRNAQPAPLALAHNQVNNNAAQLNNQARYNAFTPAERALINHIADNLEAFPNFVQCMHNAGILEHFLEQAQEQDMPAVQPAVQVEREQRQQLTDRQLQILEALKQDLVPLNRDDIQVMLIDANSNPLALANSNFMRILTREQRALAQEFIHSALDA